MRKSGSSLNIIIFCFTLGILQFSLPSYATSNEKSPSAILLEKAFRQQEKGNLKRAVEIAEEAASLARKELSSPSDSAQTSISKRVFVESCILISKGIEATGAELKGGLLDSNITWLTKRIIEFRSMKKPAVFAGDLYFTLAEKYLLWAPDFLPDLSQKQSSDSASRYLILAWRDYQSFGQTGSEAYGKLLNDLSKLAYKSRNFQTAEDYALEWVLWMEQTGINHEPGAKIWLAQCEFFNQHNDLAFKHINEGLNLAVIQKNAIAYAEGVRAYACMAYAERGTSEAAVVYSILIPGLQAAISQEGQSVLNARLMLLAGITDLMEVDPSVMDSLKDLSNQISKSINPDLALLSSPWPEFYYRIDQCRLSLLTGDTATARSRLTDLEKRLEILIPDFPEVSTHDLKCELKLIYASILLYEKNQEAALKALREYKSLKKHHPSFEKISPEAMINDRYLIREEMVNHYNLLCK